MKNFILTVLLLVLFEAQAFASVLSDLATSMKPGQWAELNTTNFSYVGACNGGTYNIIGIECAAASDYANQYAQHGAWDPINHLFYFTGAAHLSGAAPAPSGTNPDPVINRSVKFNAVTNAWTTFAKPPIFSHTYDHLAFNSINGKLYMRMYYTGDVYEYTPATNTWSASPLPRIPFGTQSGQVAGGMVFIPDLGAQGSLVYVDGDWGVQRYDFAAAAWWPIANTNADSTGFWMGSYHNLAEYNPTSRIMLFGGGNASYRGPTYDNKFYRMGSDQSFGAIADPPCSLGILKGLLVPDPTSGNFLAICPDASISEYVVSSNTWRPASIATAPMAAIGQEGIASVMFAPMPEYGAVMFVTYNQSGNSKVHLLKGLGSAPPPSSDFATRCAAPGVLRCVGFDSPADIAGGFGNNRGVFNNNSSNPLPTLDTSVKASGASSLKFTIAAGQAGSYGGQFFINFSDDLLTQFDGSPGKQDFYVQWRQRWDSAVPFTNTGFKQAIIGAGDAPGCTPSFTSPCQTSCTNLEIVTQNNGRRGFPQQYHSCGTYAPFEEFVPPSDFKLQNARPSPFCLYSQGNTVPKTFYPPSGNCIPYLSGEWMTFQVHVHVGPYDAALNRYVGSHVDVWVGGEGQAAQQTFNWPIDLIGINSSIAYGKVWLLPYSGDDVYNPAADVHVNYDELIISRNKIADPGGITPPPPPPPQNAAPVVSAGPDQTITLPAGATLNGTATDDGLPTNSLTTVWSTITGPGTVTFANASAAKTTATFSTSGAYVLNLKATDGSLTVSDDVLVLVNPPPVATNSIDVNTNTSPVVKVFRCNNDGCSRILQVKKSDKVTINGTPQK